MKRLIFASALLFLLVGITSLAPAPKYKYSSDEGKLTVTFPGEFETSEEQKETYKSVKTQAVVDDMVFFVGYTIHESDMADTDELTKVSLDAFINGLNGVVSEETTWKVKKNSGLKALFNVSDNGLKGEYRVVIIGQIQYQITAVSSVDAWDEKVAQKFFKSFKLKA